MNEEFHTSDIKFSAFLKASGVEFLRCFSQGPRKVFVFVNVPELEDLRNDYFARKPSPFSALTLFDEFDALKSLTHMRY